MAGGPCPYKNCCPRPGAPGGQRGIRGATEGVIATGLICENCACKKAVIMVNSNYILIYPTYSNSHYSCYTTPMNCCKAMPATLYSVLKSFTSLFISYDFISIVVKKRCQQKHQKAHASPINNEERQNLYKKNTILSDKT